MNPRQHAQPYLNNSLMIRQEIQRFESVHPSIYAIYDLIEAIPDIVIQQQVREHVVCIEDSFVNSQEWTLARAVPDIKLGIVGAIQSGKSALVHRYLTGSYMQEESPEGGRFKKELVLDGQSYLLLIRDEGGPPELQFTHWVDAVIFVFSLENEMSFNAIYSYYAKMAHYRNTNEIPLILVGTQDAISETSPRVIDDTRARKLANDLRKCAYYETCATYGLNVERVFQDACAKIIQQRLITASPSNSRSTTPNHSIQRNYFTTQPSKPYDTHSTGSQSSGGSHTPPNSTHSLAQNQGSQPSPQQAVFKTPSNPPDHKHSQRHKENKTPPQQIPQSHIQLQVHPNIPPDDSMQAAVIDEERMQFVRELPGPDLTPMVRRKNRKSSAVTKSNSFSQHGVIDLDKTREYPSHYNPNAARLSSSLPNYYKGSVERERTTPSSTPILSRKNKHKSSFTTKREKQDKMDTFMKDLQIPTSSPLTPILTRVNRVRSSLSLDHDQADLPTPSSTPTQNRKNRRRSNIFTPNKKEDEILLKEAKEGKGKKLDEVGSGRTIPVKQGYLYKKSTKGLNKEWKKKYVTLLDNGVLTYHPSLHDYMNDVHKKEISLMQTTVKIPGMKPRGSRGPSTTTNGDVAGKENVPGDTSQQGGDDAYIISNSLVPGLANGAETALAIGASTAGTRIQTNAKIETPNVKKRHKRAKSNTKTDSGNMEDSDGYEFMIVSLTNQQWYFEAPTHEEREEWVTSIEQQILNSLQGIQSSKSQNNQTKTDPAAVQAIRNTPGNSQCVDCGAANPDWASLNLGALMCIECSGIHRNLGTHLSRVRSLDLDEWPPELTAVMTAVGNKNANTIWEGNLKGQTKPGSQSSREDKEKWIRAKYEQKEFLRQLSIQDHSASQQIIDAVARQDVPFLILLLAHANSDHINAPYSNRDSRTPLHIAAALGNVVIVQLLLWYGANVKVADQDSRTALWYARSTGAQDCIDLLVNNDCPEHGIPPQRRPSHSKTSDVFDKLPASVI